MAMFMGVWRRLLRGEALCAAQSQHVRSPRAYVGPCLGVCHHAKPVGNPCEIHGHLAALALGSDLMGSPCEVHAKFMGIWRPLLWGVTSCAAHS